MSPSPTTDRQGEPRRSFLRRLGGVLLSVVVILAVLAGGAAAAYYLMKTGPKAKRHRPPRQALLVDVEVVASTKERARVQAMGIVGPAKVIDLQPRVSGEVIEVSPECVPGGRFRAGDLIAKLDPDDYKLAVEQQKIEIKRLAAQAEQRRSEVLQRESDVALSQCTIEQRQSAIEQADSDLVRAEAALEIELGQQSVAKREFELLGQAVREEDRNLVLRQPHLKTAQATLDAAKSAKRSALAAKRAAEASKKAAEALKQSAEAASRAAEASKEAAEVALKKAELDSSRTIIKAPFNAAVESESVDRGSQVSPTTKLARLVGTDEYWVEVSVPVDQLKWLRIPRSENEKGSKVWVYNEAAWGTDVSREGDVVRLASSLETEGRMARLLVLVKDPLGLEDESGKTPALLIGSYVRVEIEGKELGAVVAVGRERVHDGDRVWVMAPDGKLDIRKVGIVFRGRDRVLVSRGLVAGERLVTTDLAAPVHGMPLRTRDEKSAAGPRAEGEEASRP